ncbi:hypothetical protein IEO21_02943 [Rhodonia placenta]|uniref:Uncharacterized protein n=1 Tax=Rhodonia placenta TaxID=104341 RepID=A0A8H7P6N2_9APHY|nr:hypothetical protein IEO21_02943 [Postia placenta]
MDASHDRIVVAVYFDELHNWEMYQVQSPFMHAPRPRLHTASFRTILEGEWSMEKYYSTNYASEMTTNELSENVRPAEQSTPWTGVNGVNWNRAAFPYEERWRHVQGEVQYGALCGAHSYDQNGIQEHRYEGCVNEYIRSNGLVTSNIDMHSYRGGVHPVESGASQVDGYYTHEENHPNRNVGWYLLPTRDGWYYGDETRRHSEQMQWAQCRQEIWKVETGGVYQKGRHQAEYRQREVEAQGRISEGNSPSEVGWYPLPGGGRYWGKKDRHHGEEPPVQCQAEGEWDHDMKKSFNDAHPRDNTPDNERQRELMCNQVMLACEDDHEPVNFVQHGIIEQRTRSRPVLGPMKRLVDIATTLRGQTPLAPGEVCCSICNKVYDVSSILRAVTRKTARKRRRHVHTECLA